MRQSVAPNELLHTYFCSFTYENIQRLDRDDIGETTRVVYIRRVDLEPDGS